ncbi:MAG: aminopeptidase P family protein [Candidatus Omnitrophica bacterium]|nr:aminopeptidase P family protein [Candidatus Omnitrophota bacterium]
MNQRIIKLLGILEEYKLDGMLVSLPANITYLTKYRSRDSYLLISKRGNIYFTDSRYNEEAKLHLKGIASIVKINGSLFKLIAKYCLDLGLKRLGFEERYLPYAEHQKINSHLRKKVALIPTHSLIEKIRQLKDNQEIEKIKQALQITAAAFEFIKKVISPGVREIEIDAEIERFIRYNGADNPAFDIIVASGPNSAYPHHITSQRKLENNELVLIDMGVDYLGYKSDLTRVFFLGKINSLAQEIYTLTKKAQEKALKSIYPGAKASEVDRVAREFLAKKGYAKFFGHNLGHGVGLEIHEEPRLSPKSEDILTSGMVVTVEPGIYLTGKFGVRIEDMVLITNKGCEVLSGSLDK